jgi:pyruvate kinase
MPVTSATELRAGEMTGVDPEDVEVVETLLALRSAALELEETCRARLDAIPERDRPSGRNLVHYLALRQQDLRDLQGEWRLEG